MWEELQIRQTEVFSRVHATVQPALSVCRSSHQTTYFTILALTGVFCIAAPAHQHVTWVAVYPALFLKYSAKC